MMQEATTTQLEQSIKFLQLIATTIGILSVLGPILIAALLWKISRSFASKDDLNGLGSRVTAYESFSIATRERADNAHERVDKLEAGWKVELRYIRRDLDHLLDKKRRDRTSEERESGHE